MKKMSRSGLDQTIRRSSRLAAAVAVGGLTLLGFAGTANAGTASATGDCYNATLTWAATEPFGDVAWLTAEIRGSDGSYVSKPAKGTMDVQHATTYRLEFIAHNAIEQEDGTLADEVWGVVEVTTPARDPNCDVTPSTTTPPTEVPPVEEVPAEVPPTTEATATSVASAGPIVESVPPIAPEVLSSGLAAQPAGGELPATGRNTDLLLLAGTLTAAAGVSLLIIRRRSNTIAVD